MIAVAARGGAQRGGVRAGVGFGQRESAGEFARGEPRQMALFLCVGPSATSASEPMPVLVPTRSPECHRAAAISNAPRTNVRRKPCATEVARNAPAEIAQFAHALNEIRRHGVRLLDFVFTRHRFFSVETRDSARFESKCVGIMVMPVSVM